MTAPAVPEGLEPLAVWDTRGVESAWRHYMGEASEWAQRHIPEAARTYRAEFYLLDAPFAVLHRYKLNANGCKYALTRYEFITDGEAATEPPVIVPLAELPPAHLLKG